VRLQRLGVTGTTRVDFLDLRGVPGVSVPDPEAPRLALAPPGPNPTGATGAEIRFSLAAPGPTTLAIYDVTGRRVNTLLSRFLPQGPHSVRWDATDERGARVAGGVYFLRLAAAGRTLVRSVVVLP
jgi:hypothetical protein